MSTNGYEHPVAGLTVPTTVEEYRRQADYIVSRFPEKLATLTRRLRFAADLLALFRYMTDPDVHWVKKALVVGALLYFIVPTDAIPDFAPVVGYLDDIGVVALVVRYLGKQLKGYYGWEAATGGRMKDRRFEGEELDQSFV